MFGLTQAGYREGLDEGIQQTIQQGFNQGKAWHADSDVYLDAQALSVSFLTRQQAVHTSDFLCCPILLLDTGIIQCQNGKSAVKHRDQIPGVYSNAQN